MEKRYYIAYGSNLNIPQMRMRCPGARIIGTSVIEGYRLLFKGSRTGSYLTIEPQEGACVPVAAWEVSAENEAALDCYEGFPTFYYKKEMELPLKGIRTGKVRLRKVFVYIMHEERPLGFRLSFTWRPAGRATAASALTRRSWNGRMPTARRGRRGNFRAGGKRGIPATWSPTGRKTAPAPTPCGDLTGSISAWRTGGGAGAAHPRGGCSAAGRRRWERRRMRNETHGREREGMPKVRAGLPREAGSLAGGWKDVHMP